MEILTAYKDLIFEIIGSAMAVHNELGGKLAEPVYQESLFLELLDRGIACEREAEIRCYYKHHELRKRYKMDLVVDDIIVEAKSTTKLLPEHRAQLCNYLRLTHKPIGLLINFGEDRLVDERWMFDIDSNVCYIVDKNLNPIPQLSQEDY